MRVSLYRALPLLPALLIALVGCASAQPPTVQELAQRCAAMGYQPASEALANCVERQMVLGQLDRDARAEASAARWARLGDAMQEASARMQPPARQGTSCIATGPGSMWCN